MTRGWRKLNDCCHDLYCSPDIKALSNRDEMLGTCKTERSEMSTYFVLKPEEKRPSKIFVHVKG
jgi:hypothetical protein